MTDTYPVAPATSGLSRDALIAALQAAARRYHARRTADRLAGTPALKHTAHSLAAAPIVAYSPTAQRWYVRVPGTEYGRTRTAAFRTREAADCFAVAIWRQVWGQPAPAMPLIRHERPVRRWRLTPAQVQAYVAGRLATHAWRNRPPAILRPGLANWLLARDQERARWSVDDALEEWFGQSHPFRRRHTTPYAGTEALADTVTFYLMQLPARPGALVSALVVWATLLGPVPLWIIRAAAHDYTRRLWVVWGWATEQPTGRRYAYARYSFRTRAEAEQWAFDHGATALEPRYVAAVAAADWRQPLPLYVGELAAYAARLKEVMV